MRWIDRHKPKLHLNNNQQEFNMEKKGYVQGNMNPDVKDYQPKMESYSQHDANKTTEYVSKRDRIQNDMSKDIKKQAYKGRYD